MDDSDYEFEDDIEDIRRLAAVVDSTIDTTLTASKIEAALALNRSMDEKYQLLEVTLQKRLEECKNKLKSLENYKNSSSRSTYQKDEFRYMVCGRPYFKDKFLYPAPDNDDTITMRKSKMLDYILLSSVTGWTLKDKRELQDVLLLMSQQARHELRPILNKDEENDTLAKKGLTELALPIEYEYDWQTIANIFNYRHSPEEYRALWRLFLHPSINKSHISSFEHFQLEQIANKYNCQDWDKIAEELNTNRTGYQCFIYYKTHVSSGNIGQKWTKEEDEYLRRIVEFYKEGEYIPWGKVASLMENRTKIQIYNRWINSTKPKIKKGRFLPEEDTVLLACVKEFGPNFKKATKYVKGRTTSQLRTRYNIAIKTNVSAVWTVEEDKKLLQLVSHEDSSSCYAKISKYFPGKDRASVRLRYITLQKWMHSNPTVDIAEAPRRKARRLSHGQVGDNLELALENLKKRLTTEIKKKNSKKLNENSFESTIDDAIITFLTNEYIEEQNSEKNTVSEHTLDGNETENKEKNIQLCQLLVLLKANLNKTRYLSSKYAKKYAGIIDLHQNLNMSAPIRTYSKKEVCVKSNFGVINYNSVWSKNRQELQFILPPSYSTIIGCRKLMLFASKKSGQAITNALYRNPYLKQQYDLLLERFEILFLWPLLLSNFSPNAPKIVEID